MWLMRMCKLKKTKILKKKNIRLHFVRFGKNMQIFFAMQILIWIQCLTMCVTKAKACEAQRLKNRKLV